MASKKRALERAAKPLKSDTPSPEIASKEVRHDERNPRLVLATCIVLAIATVAVYAQTAHFGFVAYDDDQYVYENPIVKTGVTASNLMWAATTFFYANWHPLTWISYFIDVDLFGVNAGLFTWSIWRFMSPMGFYFFLFCCE
jgi:hypothetical protein